MYNCDSTDLKSVCYRVGGMCHITKVTEPWGESQSNPRWGWANEIS